MSRTSWEKLDPRLQRYLADLLQRGSPLAFVVLFGSRARGDWTEHSDFDLLIGLKEDDGKRFIDRLLDFQDRHGAPIEAFPYSRSEWERMFRTWHPLLLEALEYGIVLWDDGSFAAMRKRFQEWRRRGWLEPWEHGWHIRVAVPPNLEETEVS